MPRWVHIVAQVVLFAAQALMAYQQDDHVGVTNALLAAVQIFTLHKASEYNTDGTPQEVPFERKPKGGL